MQGESKAAIFADLPKFTEITEIKEQ
jgi:hypothetical protein